MDEYRSTYSNGFLERKQGGKYEGMLSIESINLSPIEGVYFKENGQQYLWIKRKQILEYDNETTSYKPRNREPTCEIYLQKQGFGTIAYKGEFAFMRFKFSIVGVWDAVFGKDRNRLNFFVERLPMSQQTIINAINDRNKKTEDEE